MRFRLRTILIVVSICCILAAIIMVPISRITRSRRALEEVEQICRAVGGRCSRDLVDGYYTIDLSNTSAGDTELIRVSQLCKELPIGALDYTDQVRLFIGRTHVGEEGITSLLIIRDKLVGLDVTGLPVSDTHIKELAVSSPNLAYLSLSGTHVTDASAASLKLLTSLTYLDVSNTQMTPASLVDLISLPHLWHLNVTGIIENEEELPEEFKEVGRCEIVWK